MGSFFACDNTDTGVEASADIALSDLISALSYGLDLTEGQPMGHAVRSCLIGLRIADELQLSKEDKRSLYYAALLKDAGCSSSASKIFHLLGCDEIVARRDVSVIDWSRRRWDTLQYARHYVSRGAPFFERVRKLVEAGVKQKSWAREMIEIRCERGAQMARHMGFPEAVETVIRTVSEHWDGRGYPRGLADNGIPLVARILSLAQTLETFYTQRSPKIALDAIQERANVWFDPELVNAALELSRRGALFADLETGRTRESLIALEPVPEGLAPERIDRICGAFAEIIDAKSPFTPGHSEGVARAAMRIAAGLGLKAAETQFVRRAALLHDLGKLALPNSVLEKPDKLHPEEWQAVKKHPYYTMEILRHIAGFGEIAEIAASHHEKLDGSGYYRNLTAARLSLNARIVAVADAFDALSSKRPYRDAYRPEKVCKILRSEAPWQLDADCVQALIASFDSETEQLARLNNALLSYRTAEAPALDLTTAPSGRMR
jgi:putative nucleotidyltransferase with HDIG domain